MNTNRKPVATRTFNRLIYPEYFVETTPTLPSGPISNNASTSYPLNSKNVFPPLHELFPESTCYHFLEGRCSQPIYKRRVEYPFCKEHRYKYAQMIGIIDFQTPPLSALQHDYLIHTFEELKMDFQFELKQYKRFRGTVVNSLLEDILIETQQELNALPIVQTQGERMKKLVGDTFKEERTNGERIHGEIYRPIQIPTKVERPLHTDTQNVHRKEVREAQNPMLFDLLKTDIGTMDVKTLLQSIRTILIDHKKDHMKKDMNIFKKIYYRLFGLYEDIHMKTAFRSIQKESQSTYMFSYLNPDTNLIKNFTYKEIIEKAMYRIIQSKNKQELSLRLLEEVREGIGYCNVGKLTRLLNTFTGFDDFIQVDTRSLNERISDAMIEIRRTTNSLQDKQQRALYVLSTMGVPNEERDVWIEAFEEEPPPL